MGSASSPRLARRSILPPLDDAQHEPDAGVQRPHQAEGQALRVEHRILVGVDHDVVHRRDDLGAEDPERQEVGGQHEAAYDVGRVYYVDFAPASPHEQGRKIEGGYA